MSLARPSGFLEVCDYWHDRDLCGSPRDFYDHWEQRDWMILQNKKAKLLVPMKSWKIAANTWSRNAKRWAAEKPANRGFDPNVGRPLPPEERGE